MISTASEPFLPARSELAARRSSSRGARSPCWRASARSRGGRSSIFRKRHGLGIARRVEQITQGAFRVTPGSLFPALHRLAQKGWLTAEWGRSETNRKAKYYELTSAGRRHTDEEVRNWKRVSVAIELALRDVGEA